MYELIIIGAGPAGISAAVYAARKRLKTLLIAGDVGGQVNWTSGIENYIGYQLIEGSELISKFQEQVNQFPIDQKIGTKVTRVLKLPDNSFELVTDTGDKFQGKAVLAAMGKRPRRLNVPGEIELTGRGVTYCAVCDGPIFAEQRVAVVGGGNSALEAALDMVKIAAHVDVISPLPLSGDKILIERLSAANNINFLIGYSVTQITGSPLVEGIEIRETKTNAIKKLDVTGIFIEIGLEPNTDAIKGLTALNDAGEIIIDCNCRTNVPGLFAAGDATNIPEKQIIIAAGEGAKAALQAHRYLQRLSV
ncbi:MAG TPA: FAD-dependent oxidoreductase [Dehalococcoidales bacterium]|nr:FAD-dependent oxidoreductase [Dehalococcoidales bacterium]